MSDYDALHGYSLSQHGDNREKELWDLVENKFSAYQVFWRWYIVPLTNRIVLVDSSSPEWIRLRKGITCQLEQMAMYHYSIFYYLARATQLIRANHPYPEDVFALFDACSDNLAPRVSGELGFFGTIEEIHQRLAKGKLGLPAKNHLRTDNVCPALAAIQKYRDVILHNPVLGRGIYLKREFLPVRTALDGVKLSWRAAGELRQEKWVDFQTLYAELYDGLTTFLEKTWRKIIDAMNVARERKSSDFNTLWMLQSLLPIRSAPLAVSSVSASATTIPAVLSSSTKSL
jgi:hypothetical protein